jgi:hypothetical protein
MRLIEARGLAPTGDKGDQLALSRQFRLAGGRDQLDGVFNQRRIDVDLIGCLLQGQELLGMDHTCWIDCRAAVMRSTMTNSSVSDG